MSDTKPQIQEAPRNSKYNECQIQKQTLYTLAYHIQTAENQK